MDPHGYRRLFRLIAAIAATVLAAIALAGCVLVPVAPPTSPDVATTPPAEPEPDVATTPPTAPEPTAPEPSWTPDDAAFLAAVHDALPETRGGELDDTLLIQGSMSCAYADLDSWLDVIDPNREPMLTRLSSAIYAAARPHLCQEG